MYTDFNNSFTVELSNVLRRKLGSKRPSQVLLHYLVKLECATVQLSVRGTFCFMMIN